MGNDKRIVPLPAVFDGSKARQADPKGVQAQTWTFEETDGTGTTDLHSRHMTLPMGDAPDHFGVRVHEMLHAALSPYDVAENQQDTRFLAAEDGRIESIATAEGIERPSGIPAGQTVIPRLLAQGNLASAMECSVAVVGAPNESVERDALLAMGTPEALDLLDLMDWAAGQYAADPSVNSAYAVANRLRDILGEPPVMPKGMGGPATPEASQDDQQDDDDQDKCQDGQQASQDDDQDDDGQQDDQDGSDDGQDDQDDQQDNGGNASGQQDGQDGQDDGQDGSEGSGQQDDDGQDDAEDGSDESDEDDGQDDDGQQDGSEDDQDDAEDDGQDDDGQDDQDDAEDGSDESDDAEDEDDQDDDGQDEDEDDGQGTGSGTGQGNQDDDGQQESSGTPGDHLKAAVELGGAGAAGSGPGLHGQHIDRPEATRAREVQPQVSAETQERKIDKDAKPGRPKSVVPVDLAAMAEWMPMRTAPGQPNHRGGEPVWGRTEIQYPARPIRIVQRERGHKSGKPTDYGATPKAMHRLPVDSKIFGSKRHTRQGTVLVDMSGSMSLSQQEIQELIDYAPAGVIAGYAGQHGPDARGIIRILAADGKMVNESDLDLGLGGNTVDGPAIAWLAAQRGPRVLVSDGLAVDSRGNCPGMIPQTYKPEKETGAMKHWKNTEKKPIIQQVIRIIQKHRITVVLNPKDAKKFLR